MLPQQHFDGTSPNLTINHLVAFENMCSISKRNGSINTFDEFKICLCWCWQTLHRTGLETVMNGKVDMDSLKETFLKRFNSRGYIQGEQYTYQYNMKCNIIKHGVDQFPRGWEY